MAEDDYTSDLGLMLMANSRHGEVISRKSNVFDSEVGECTTRNQDVILLHVGTGDSDSDDDDSSSVSSRESDDNEDETPVVSIAHIFDLVVPENEGEEIDVEVYVGESSFLSLGGDGVEPSEAVPPVLTVEMTNDDDDESISDYQDDDIIEDVNIDDPENNSDLDSNVFYYDPLSDDCESEVSNHHNGANPINTANVTVSESPNAELEDPSTSESWVDVLAREVVLPSPDLRDEAGSSDVKICSLCTFENAPNTTQCVMCHVLLEDLDQQCMRLLEEDEYLSRAAAGNVCDKCTYVNERDAALCDMCGSKLSQKKPKVREDKDVVYEHSNESFAVSA